METVFTYEVMGTVWKVTLYEAISEDVAIRLEKNISEKLRVFDGLYSRFKDTSLITELSKKTGLFEVPDDLVKILRIYKRFYHVSEKKFTPCIGNLLEDVGYDDNYSLREKDTKRNVPDFDTTVVVIDDTHIELHESVLLDIGAIGKGYFVDVLTEYLRECGYTEFLVDGSGDVYFESKGDSIKVGLEHPGDTSQIVGMVEMRKGAMCSSAASRRSWGKYSHYIDPESKESPTVIIATWVMSESTALSDALSSLLFFVAPEVIVDVSFSYCIMNHENKIKKSPDFLATFF
jgi:FAD:protein FMN transferase